jgi:hypothetical protein
MTGIKKLYVRFYLWRAEARRRLLVKNVDRHRRRYQHALDRLDAYNGERDYDDADVWA